MTASRSKTIGAGNGTTGRRYISFDSTNKHCQVGDIELAENGHKKDKGNKSVFNYTVAYDRNNRVPLFYKAYPGRINDVFQLQFMLAKAVTYGYKNAWFILDCGYFSETMQLQQHKKISYRHSI